MKALVGQKGLPSSVYLPTDAADTVPLAIEVGHILDQPVIDLSQSQPLLRATLYGLGDEISVGQVAPRVAPRRGPVVAGLDSSSSRLGRRG